MIFVDGNFISTVPSDLAPASCHKSTTYMVAWQPPSRQLVVNAIFAYIVLLFVTVLTVFINDFDSVK